MSTRGSVDLDLIAYENDCERIDDTNARANKADSDNDDASVRISYYNGLMIDAVTGPLLRAALGVRK